ncbi:uncharacterized protein METZ01_LOCUS407610, partial [marine metagenome]
MTLAGLPDDTGGFMRRTVVVVFLWLAATAGVVYVANTAVELVDLQVFPGGSRIEVLSLPGPSEPSTAVNPEAETVSSTTTTASTTTASPTTVPPDAVATTTSTTTTSTTTTPTTTTLITT